MKRAFKIHWNEGPGKALEKDENISAMQWEAEMLELFYPWWNLDHESPFGIFCLLASQFVAYEVHSFVCACVLEPVNRIYQEATELQSHEL